MNSPLNVAYTELAYVIVLNCSCGESLKSIWWKHEETKSLHRKGKMSYSLLKAVRFTTGEILHLSFNHPFTYKYILSAREWFEVRQSFKQLKVFKNINPFFGQESWNPFSPSLFLSHFLPFFSMHTYFYMCGTVIYKVKDWKQPKYPRLEKFSSILYYNQLLGYFSAIPMIF